MNKSNVSAHIFLYYIDTGIDVLNKLKEMYNGYIYLSLVKDNPNNKALIKHAESLFDIDITYVQNGGSDQYGFFHSFKNEKNKKSWTLYLHDKHVTKKQWLSDLIDPLKNINNELLNAKTIGIISAQKHVHEVKPMNMILQNYGGIRFEHRRKIVESLHTVIWLKELQRILLEKYGLINEDHIYPNFSAGNIFVAKTEVIEKAHGCIYEEFFNKNTYREDGEVAHGLERFYFYVSKCLNYNNLFI